MSKELKAYIVDVIKAECEQVYLALKQDVAKLVKIEVERAMSKESIAEKIGERLSERLDETLDSKLDEKLDSKLRATEEKNNQQLALVAHTNKQALAKVMIGVEKAAVNKTIKYINEKIVPMVENQMEFIAHQTLDGTELATEYRRAVYSDNVPKLTSGDAKADNQAKFFFFTEHDN